MQLQEDRWDVERGLNNLFQTNDLLKSLPENLIDEVMRRLRSIAREVKKGDLTGGNQPEFERRKYPQDHQIELIKSQLRGPLSGTKKLQEGLSRRN